MNIRGLDERVLEVRVVSNKHFSDKSRARAAYISEAWRSPSLSMRLGGTLDLGHLDARRHQGTSQVLETLSPTAGSTRALRHHGTAVCRQRSAWRPTSSSRSTTDAQRNGRFDG